MISGGGSFFVNGSQASTREIRKMLSSGASDACASRSQSTLEMVSGPVWQVTPFSRAYPTRIARGACDVVPWTQR